MIKFLKLVTGGAVMTADPLVDPHLVGVVVQGLLQHGCHPGTRLVALSVNFKIKQLWGFNSYTLAAEMSLWFLLWICFLCILVLCATFVFLFICLFVCFLLI